MLGSIFRSTLPHEPARTAEAPHEHAVRIVARCAVDHVQPRNASERSEACPAALELRPVPGAQVGIRCVDRYRPPADEDSIPAGRRKFSLDRIVNMDEEDVAVTRELEEMPLGAVAQAAKVAQEKAQAPGPSDPREPLERVLGAGPAARPRKLARHPERIVRDELQHRERRPPPETRPALVVLRVGEHEPAET